MDGVVRWLDGGGEESHRADAEGEAEDVAALTRRGNPVCWTCSLPAWRPALCAAASSECIDLHFERGDSFELHVLFVSYFEQEGFHPRETPLGPLHGGDDGRGSWTWASGSFCHLAHFIHRGAREMSCSAHPRGGLPTQKWVSSSWIICVSNFSRNRSSQWPPYLSRHCRHAWPISQSVQLSLCPRHAGSSQWNS
jgi:hypothetical protein